MSNLLIPAAGYSRRFQKAGYKGPKGLLTHQGETMIEMIVRSLSGMFAGCPKIVVRPEEAEAYRQVLPNYEIILMPEMDDFVGQSATICEGLKHCEGPTLISNCDVIHRGGIGKIEAPFMASVIKTENDTDYSFIDSYPEFTRAEERNRISQYAMSGLYKIQNPQELMAAILRQAPSPLNGELYLSGAIENLQQPSLAFEVDPELVVDLGTPEKWEAQCS